MSREMYCLKRKNADTEFTPGLNRRKAVMRRENGMDGKLRNGYVIAHYLEVGYGTDMVYGGIVDGEKVVFTEMPESS